MFLSRLPPDATTANPPPRFRVLLALPVSCRPPLCSERRIGRANLARENEAGGSWGHEVHILHVNI